MGVMLRRILMALLVACLALPAVAAPVCHATPAAASHAMHHGQKQHEDSVPQLIHGCIGCVTPPRVDLAVALPPALPAIVPVPAALPHLATTRASPDTPPPRFV